MFKQPTRPGYGIPSFPVEKVEIIPAQLGGGFVVAMHLANGKIEHMVFPDLQKMSQTLAGIFTLAGNVAQQQQAPANVPFRAIAPQSPTIERKKPEPPVAPAAEAAKPEPEPAPVEAVASSPKKKGRPKLTEEEKAANKARREAQKGANGVDHAGQKLSTKPENQAAEAAA
jgi:outer membrane biosynthesis protein TonB